MNPTKFAVIAQLVEQHISNVQVFSSSLNGGSISSSSTVGLVQGADNAKIESSNLSCSTIITNPSDMAVATRCGRMAVV